MNPHAKLFLVMWGRFLVLAFVWLAGLSVVFGFGALLWHLMGWWSILVMATLLVTAGLAIGYVGFQLQEQKEKAERDRWA